MNFTGNLFENFNTKKLITYFVMLVLFVYMLYLSISNVIKYSSNSKIFDVASYELQDIDAKIGNKISTQIIIQKNESFDIALKKHNINLAEIVKLKKILKEQNLIKKIRAESIIELQLIVNKLTQGGLEILDATIYNPNKISIIKITKNNNNSFNVKEEILQLTRNIVKIKTQIGHNLFSALKSLGIPLNAIHEISSAYSHQIDFQRQIRYGDCVELLIEKYNKPNEEFSHYGNIVFSKLNLSDKVYELYRYGTENNKYYSAEGKSFGQNLLKTPLKASRISGHFGQRKHPILGYTRMHKGIDFAAPHGTAIYASGDGVITEIGKRNGYGNYIKIKHSSNLSTLYAHISRFNQELKVGNKVKQGKTIAYVGSTGTATGPHLHYEVHVNGRQVNPITIKTLSNNLLAKADLGKFIAYKNQLNDINKFLDRNVAYQVAQ